MYLFKATLLHNRSGSSSVECPGIRHLLYLSLVFCVRFLAPLVAIGGCAFAIIDAEFRNASIVTPMALRRVFEARHRA